MATMQLLRPQLGWVWVQSDRPFEVPLGVLDVPGVRWLEPEIGYECWRCEVPSSAWALEPVKLWLGQLFGGEQACPDELDVLPSLGRELYEHQREAVAFFLRARGALLGDSMGLGKSSSAIVAAEVVRRRGVRDACPVLIIGPKSVCGVWRSEVEAVLPGARFVALEGTDPGDHFGAQRFWLERAEWIYIHFDIVHAWWSQILLRRPCVAIVDEAHLVRNGRTRRGQAAALAVSASAHRYLLTGTPILNRVGELWHLLNLVTGPFQWGSPRDFRCRYAGAVRDMHGYRDTEPTHVDELQTRVEGVYLRRTVEDVALSLPPLTRQVIEVTPSTAEREAYASHLDGLDVRAVLGSILSGSASRKTLAWLSALRKITSRMKLEATIVEAQSALDAGESVVVFTWQRETAERIANKLEAPGGSMVIHGGVLPAIRESFIEQFQEVGGAIVATIDSLSVGVTLHRSRVVIMHDLDWVPANMLQAEARVYRIGQSRPVISKWMVAQGTLDQLFLRAARIKAGAMASLGDVSGTGLADALGEDELDAGVESLLRWAREG